MRLSSLFFKTFGDINGTIFLGDRFFFVLFLENPPSESAAGFISIVLFDIYYNN